MARKPTKKTGKAKKAVPKRGVAKKATPRKGLSKAERNKLMLANDIEYYEANKDKLVRRSKPTEQHKRGLLASSFRPEYDNQGNQIGFRSLDDTQHISNVEYTRLTAVNPRAVPRYIPIKEGKKIVAYQNSITGRQVTPYYRHQIFGKYFRNLGEEENVGVAYLESLEHAKREEGIRSNDLIDSYALRNPQFLEIYGEKRYRSVIARDPEFNRLVEQLRVFSTGQRFVASGQVAEEIELVSGYVNKVKVSHDPEYQEALRILYGEDPDYQNVLVLLGRRKPDETRPVGTYGPGYIKAEVVPYYESIFSNVEFEE